MVHACPPLGVRSFTYSDHLKLSSHNPLEIEQHFARIDERFNGKFRDECLSMEWFRCRAEARVVIEEGRRPDQEDW